MIYRQDKMWSAEKEIICKSARRSRCEKLRQSPLCKRITFVENFGAMEKNMRKNCIFHVDFRYKNRFSNPFCHILKMTKTLATSGFSEFFTKFSTGGGKLFPYVRNIIVKILLKRNFIKRSALIINFFLLTRKSCKKNKKRAVLSLYRCENKPKVLSPPRVRFLLAQKLLGTAANLCIL